MARRAANAGRAARFLQEHGVGLLKQEKPTIAKVNQARANLLRKTTEPTSFASAAKEAGAFNVVEVKANSTAFQKMVVCTATSVRHACAVADDIADAMNAVVYDRRQPWVVVDGGDVVVHVLTQEQREAYQLEMVWDENDKLRRDMEASDDQDSRR